MNKFYTILLITVIIGCNSSGSISVESLIENKDLPKFFDARGEKLNVIRAAKLSNNIIWKHQKSW